MEWRINCVKERGRSGKEKRRKEEER